MGRPLMYRKGDIITRRLDGKVIERKILDVDNKIRKYLLSEGNDHTKIYGWVTPWFPESRYKRVRSILFEESLNG